jgi:WD40 repeat protein
MTVDKKYLAAAIGTGFRIYDVGTGECAMEVKNAHEAEVNHLISLYDGFEQMLGEFDLSRTRLASCSADSSIKLWGTTQRLNFRKREKVSIDTNAQKSGRLPKIGSVKMEPVCLGEMWGHGDSVNQLLAFTENSFASCGSDSTLILWKAIHTRVRVMTEL